MGRVASLGRVARWIASLGRVWVVSLGRVAGLHRVIVVVDVPSSFVLPRRITPPRPSSGTLSPNALLMRPPFDNGPPLDANGNSWMPFESSEGNALLPLEANGAADHLECIAQTPPNNGTPPTNPNGNSCPSPESPEGCALPPPDEVGATNNTKAASHNNQLNEREVMMATAKGDHCHRLYQVIDQERRGESMMPPM